MLPFCPRLPRYAARAPFPPAGPVLCLLETSQACESACVNGMCLSPPYAPAHVLMCTCPTRPCAILIARTGCATYTCQCDRESEWREVQRLCVTLSSALFHSCISQKVLHCGSAFFCCVVACCVVACCVVAFSLMNSRLMACGGDQVSVPAAAGGRGRRPLLPGIPAVSQG